MSTVAPETTSDSSPIDLTDLPPLRTRRPVDIWSPILLSVLAFAAMVVNLTQWPRFEDDEGTYVGQADAVLNGSIMPYTYTYDHPFFGWFQMAPFQGFFNAVGAGDVAAIYAGRLVMAMFGAATAALIYLLARRLGAMPVFAIMSSLIWMTSALVHDDGRAVYLDNVATPWLLLAFYFALTPRQHMWHYLASALSFAVAVLSKETLVLYGPALLLAVWMSSWSRLRAMHIATFLIAGTLTVMTYPLFAALKGELFPSEDRSSLMSTAYWQFVGRDGSGSLWDATSTRYTVVSDWFYFDRWLLMAGVAAAFLCLFSRRTRVIGVAVGLGLVPVVLMSGYLPPMYHLGLIPFLAIAIGLMLSRITDVFFKARNGERTRRNVALMGGSLALLTALLVSGVYFAAPERASRLSDAWTSSGVGDFYEAREWALANIPEGDVVVTNGELWNDFYRAGWTTEEVIPFTKLDRDPDLSEVTPEWIVMTPTLARDAGNDALAARFQEYYEDSTVVQTFGEYSVRRVN